MVLRGSGRDLRGGRRRFESHGWRLGRGPWRREGRSGKSSGLGLICYYCTVACPYHTLGLLLFWYLRNEGFRAAVTTRLRRAD